MSNLKVNKIVNVMWEYFKEVNDRKQTGLLSTSVLLAG